MAVKGQISHHKTNQECVRGDIINYNLGNEKGGQIL
jgi:hypothetical protein